MPNKLLILAGLAFCSIASIARAADSAPSGVDPAALFEQLDTSGDGLLAGDEIPAEKQTLFDRLVRLGDGNADGKLSAEEFAAGLSGGEKPPAAKSPASVQQPAKAKPGRPGKAERPRPGQFFARLDANSDGKVELEEVPEARREMFAKLIERNDKDGDKALSKAEFPTGTPAQNAAAKRPAEGRDPAELFRRIDRDADGKVVASEVPEARREMVTRMIERGDKDGDEALSLEEFSGVMARVRAAQGSPAKPASAKKTKKPEKPAKPAGKKAKGNAKNAKNAPAAMPAGLFGALDADADGELNDTEINAASTAILKLDRNGDGSVSVREVARGGQAKKTKKKKTP